MNADIELLKANIRKEYEKLNEGRSQDYKDGFDDACCLLAIFWAKLYGGESIYEALLRDD